MDQFIVTLHNNYKFYNYNYDFNNKFLLHFINGTISGMFGLIISHPFDTLKTRLQNNQQLSFKPQNLYRGISSPLLGVGLEKSIVFGVYNNMFGFLKNRHLSDIQSNIISGACSGFMASFIVTPFERCKIIFQSGNNINFDNINTKYLFRGLTATFTRETPGFAIYFTMYEYMKKKIYTENNKKINNFGSFVLGGISGASSWVFIYPQDLIKTRMQSEKINTNQNFITITKSIFKQNGFKGFYKGFHFALMRAIPLHAGVFMANEWLNNK